MQGIGELYSLLFWDHLAKLGQAYTFQASICHLLGRSFSSGCPSLEVGGYQYMGCRDGEASHRGHR